MKRILFAVAMTFAAVAVANQKPSRDLLPNYDRRGVENAPERAPSEDAEKKIRALKERVPSLKVRHSKVLGRPEFFSSFNSFLSGKDGEGLGVERGRAKAFGKDDKHAPVKAFLDEHAGLIGYGSKALRGAEIRREHVGDHNGLRTVVWEQKHNGIPVFDGVIIGHITKDNELVNLYTQFIPEPARAVAGANKRRGATGHPDISAEQAIVIAAKNIGDEVDVRSVTAKDNAQGASRKQTFGAAPALNGDQYVELVWVPLNANAMRLCWQVVVISKARGEGFLVIVDAETGEVLVRRNLTNYISDISLRVYTSDSPSPFSPGHPVPLTNQPPLVSRVLVVTNALNTNASPLGWITDGVNETIGNNVDAHTDRNDDDAPDLPRPTGSPFRVFDYPLDLTQDPTNYSAASVVQCFYWNNFIHDKLYELGFTEAAGNFQSTNFGRGGLGNDAVSADAQDGGGFDNANMLTLPDGIPPRMQMYIFSGPRPMRDGDLDGEVVLHEYTHGLSNRRVGGGVGISALQTAGMGEGWSDFYAMSLLSEPTDNIAGNYPMGGYVTLNIGGSGFLENYYYGIRRFPYSTNLLKNPLTFKDIDPSQAIPHTGIPRNPIFGPFTPFDANEVHNQGEVWCVTLWEMRANLIGIYGWTNGNRLALQLVTDAMALCPVNPNFLESRDAIIQADRILTGGANYFAIWAAFAKRGMGGSATSPASNTTRGVVEAYDVPGIAFVAAFTDDSVVGNGNATIDYNECIDLTVLLRNDGQGLANGVTATLIITNPLVTVIYTNATYPPMTPGVSTAPLAPFRISTASNFVCGTPIYCQVIMSSGFGLRTNFFSLETGFVGASPVLVNNSASLAIPDANTNGAQSLINVSGFGDTLGKVTVSLFLTHAFDFDVTAELIGPDGTVVTLIQNQGGPGKNFGTNCAPIASRLTLDDNAQFAIGLGNAPFVGTFRPEQPLLNFKGKTGAAVNGAWRLRVIDGYTNNVGAIECWTLALHPILATNGGGACAIDVAVSGTASPTPAVVNADETYTLTVTNHHIVTATGVVLSNTIPANVTLVAASASQGTGCVLNGSVLSCALGDLLPTNGATVSVTVRPTIVGSLTNTFTVSCAGADVNPENNIIRFITSVVEARPLIVAAGSAITDEASPATGGIEEGETVTVALTLRNDGTAPATNLIATLLSGGGISSPTGPQNYGTLAVGASATRSFRFTANVPAGSVISAVLQLQDGIQGLGTVTFQFGVGAHATFASPAPITINAFGPANPYPSTINVSGVPGLISKVTVTLSKLTHTFPDDLDVLLVGPHGEKIMLMSDAGGEAAVTNKSLVFDASAAAVVADNGPLTTGTFLPTDYEGGDVLFGPAPSGPFTTSFSGLTAADPNGVWSLYVFDDSAGDAGIINGGWALDITTFVPVNPVANLAVSVSAPAMVLEGALFDYTITVANLGPSNATDIVVTNLNMGAGRAVHSMNPSVGSAINPAPNFDVIWSIPALANGSSATLVVTAHANSEGAVSNNAVVVSATRDPDLGNNSALALTVATRASADLALGLVPPAAPSFVTSNLAFTFSVTNRGTNGASAILITNAVPPGWSLTGYANTAGAPTNFNGLLYTPVPDLQPGQSTNVTLVFSSSATGTFGNNFGVFSITTDPVASNNSVSASTTVSPLAPIVIAAGAVLTAENVAANNAVDPGETITLRLGLRNVGTLATANLVATLLPSGGVSNPSGAVAYGALTQNGPTVSGQFTMVANVASGGALTLTLQLQDGATDLGTVTFSFPVSATYATANGGAITIRDNTNAAPYPSTINVSGIAGNVSKVTVTLNNLNHTYPEDIDILLVGPAGQKVKLMSDAGAGNSISGVNLTFDDSAAASLPANTGIVSGTFRPTDVNRTGDTADTFLSPAPAGPYASALSAFNSQNPNGTWSLYVMDDTIGDVGQIVGGWSLSIQTATQVTPSADISVSVAAAAQAELSGALTYTINVVNNGPGNASNVVLTDTLPQGFALTSATTILGSVLASSGVVTANIGSLPYGQQAVVTINGTANGSGALTNRASASATETDLAPANNTVLTVTTVGSPRLGVRLSGANIVVSWSANATGFNLQTSDSVSGPWANAPGSPVSNGGRSEMTFPITSKAFYRLHKP